MKTKIEIPAEYLTTFDSFAQWVNKASSRIGGFPKCDQLVCLDKNGNVCTCGKDFMHARDNDLFPVRAYRLTRNTDTTT